jgi:hypothetical protein
LAPVFAVSEYQSGGSVDGLHNGANPFVHAGAIVHDAPMTIGDVIEKIRFEFGDQAAASVTIVVH